MPSINPIKAIAVKAVKPNSLAKAAVGYYMSKKGMTVKKKTGRTSQKNVVARTLNRSTTSLPKGQYVKWVYARNSRVIQGTEKLLAVRLNTGEKGWINQIYGTWISEKSIRATLYSIDSTFAAGATETDLLSLYDSLSLGDKAKLAEALEDYDWDEFWELIGSDDEKQLDIDRSTTAYLMLVEYIGDVLGRLIE